MNKAFVLGAGLGERLRPLTDQLPKPLIPVFRRPLITYAFDHLLAAGVREFVVNTHHLPEAYARAFPDRSYRGAPIHFRHESPVRLETAGGIANVRDLLGDETFFVYNGDILTDLPLKPLIEEHSRRGNIVTLALRSSGPALHIALDEQKGLVSDIRGRLGTGDDGRFLFSGIYLVSPEFFEWLTPGKVESVIPVFLRMIQQNARLGGIVIDEGSWWDLGDRGHYLEAHRTLSRLNSHFPGYGGVSPHDCEPVDPAAEVSSSARLTGLNVIGGDAVIEAGAELRDCIVWSGARVAAGALLDRCIVRSGASVSGSHHEEDL